MRPKNHNPDGKSYVLLLVVGNSMPIAGPSSVDGLPYVKEKCLGQSYLHSNQAGKSLASVVILILKVLHHSKSQARGYPQFNGVW